MFRVTSCILAGVFVSGCQLSDVLPASTPKEDPNASVPIVQGPDDCGASAFVQYIGKPVSEVPIPEDRTVRVIGPDTVVTLDYNAQRLNIGTDADGNVIEARCG